VPVVCGEERIWIPANGKDLPGWPARRWLKEGKKGLANLRGEGKKKDCGFKSHLYRGEGSDRAT